jgi:hypothetical protein
MVQKNNLLHQSKMKRLLLTTVIAISSSMAWASADLMLPEEVCSVIGANSNQCTEKKVNAKFVDLNNDGVKELITNWGGGSCGSQYFVFKVDDAIKWKLIGNWCGCETGITRIGKSSHNKYLDIFTCGHSGFFDGTKYVGVRQ